jgi:hypothetical protein
MKFTVIIFLSTWILVAGCSKNKAAKKDYELPVISITTPTNNQIYSPGQILNISGTITDNDYIAEVHIHVNNLITGAEYLDEHLHPAGNATNFLNQSLTTVAGTSYKIQIMAIDRAANEAVSTVEVSCN